MGIEYLQWEYNRTHNGNRTEHTMGKEYLQWEYCITHDGKNNLQWEYNKTHNGNTIFTMGIMNHDSGS